MVEARASTWARQDQPIVPGGEAQIGFMDQRGGLQRVIVPFGGQTCVRETAKLRVVVGHQRIERVFAGRQRRRVGNRSRAIIAPEGGLGKAKVRGHTGCGTPFQAAAEQREGPQRSTGDCRYRSFAVAARNGVFVAGGKETAPARRYVAGGAMRRA